MKWTAIEIIEAMGYDATAPPRLIHLAALYLAGDITHVPRNAVEWVERIKKEIEI